MKQRICPIMVCTMEALELSIIEGYKVIYVDKYMFVEDQETILELMEGHDYTIAKKEGKSGVFFKKNRLFCI